MIAVDLEGHVCQSCGMPVSPDEMVEGSEQGDFCHMCMVHDEFVADRAEVKNRIADNIEQETGKPRSEAEIEAEDVMSKLKRWQ